MDEINRKIEDLNQRIIVKDEEIKSSNSLRFQVSKMSGKDRRVDFNYMIKQRGYLSSLKSEKAALIRAAIDLRRKIKEGGVKTLGDRFIEVARLTLPTDQFDFILKTSITLSREGGSAEDLCRGIK